MLQRGPQQHQPPPQTPKQAPIQAETFTPAPTNFQVPEQQKPFPPLFQAPTSNETFPPQKTYTTPYHPHKPTVHHHHWTPTTTTAHHLEENPPMQLGTGAIGTNAERTTATDKTLPSMEMRHKIRASSEASKQQHIT